MNLIAFSVGSFIASQILGIAVGLLIGCFIPSILRKGKSFFSGEAKVIGSKIKSKL